MVVPETTSAVLVRKLKEEGAEVEVNGKVNVQFVNAFRCVWYGTLLLAHKCLKNKVLRLY